MYNLNNFKNFPVTDFFLAVFLSTKVGIFFFFEGEEDREAEREVNDIYVKKFSARDLYHRQIYNSSVDNRTKDTFPSCNALPFCSLQLDI